MNKLATIVAATKKRITTSANRLKKSTLKRAKAVRKDMPTTIKQKAINIYAWLRKNPTIWAPIAIIILAKIIFHGIGLTNYPYYENDEATYIIRSLSFIDDGSFDLYTYWYDHAPFGWMFMSIWFFVTDNAPILGSLLNSGRVFIFLLSTISAILVYVIANRLIRDRFYATLASLVFIISPLSIYFQRRVLLDNIMVFWVLLSIYLAMGKPLKSRRLILSAITFAFAVLTKLNAIFFLPALLYAVVAHLTKKTRVVGTMLWAAISGAVMLMFPLYAVLKSELFSKNPNPETGNFDNGISLIDSLTFQSSRGSDNPALFWEQGSSFRAAYDAWWDKDPTLVIFTVLSLMMLLLLLRKSWRERFSNYITIALVVLGMVLFMIRGGVVLEFYFIPLLPFVAILAIAILAAPTKLQQFKHRYIKVPYMIMALLLTVGLQLPYAIGSQAYRYNETSNMELAIEWVKNNLDSDSYIASDNYATVFLRYEDDFTNLDYNYKYEYDPDIRGKVADDWRNIDYILLTHEVLKQIKEGETPFIKEAFDHSELVASFTDQSTSFRDIEKYVSTNGDWVNIYKVKDDNRIIAQQSWAGFLDNHFKDYGRIVDTNQPAITTSLLQSNSLVRAYNEGEVDWFDGIWAWTRDHLQSRSQDTLLSSEWTNDDEDNANSRVSNPNTTSLADLEAAYALHAAGTNWVNRSEYLSIAEQLAADFWENEVVQLNGSYYIAAQQVDSNNPTASYVVNPSHAALPYIQYFAELDSGALTEYNWQELLDDSITMLERLQNQSTGLFPNWVRVTQSGAIVSAEDFAPVTADHFGYEAFRVPVWLDQLSDALTASTSARDINTRTRVESMLTLYGEFVASEYNKNDETIFATYTQEGLPVFTFEDVLTYGTAYLGLLRTDAELAERVMSRSISPNFDTETGVWAQLTSDINNQLWLPVILQNSPEVSVSAIKPADFVQLQQQ